MTQSPPTPTKSPNQPPSAGALRFLFWGPSQWLMLVLAVWWTWRWAAIPPQHESDGLPVIAGFLHDALILYGVFGLLRVGWMRGASASRLSQYTVATALVVSAGLRALDALQVHLTGSRATVGLVKVLADDPLGSAWGLRGLVLAVIVSAIAAVGALAGEKRLAQQMRRRQVGEGARLDIVAGAALLAGVMLAVGRGADPVSAAPEWVAVEAIVEALNGR